MTKKARLKETLWHFRNHLLFYRQGKAGKETVTLANSAGAEQGEVGGWKPVQRLLQNDKGGNTRKVSWTVLRSILGNG